MFGSAMKSAISRKQLENSGSVKGMPQPAYNN
jgi:hypothetical protein